MARSQVILRMPVDNLVATLILHDGERAEVMLFLPGGEDLARLLDGTAQFIPMVRDGRVCLFARAAIACLEVPARPPAADDDGLPVEKQRAIVKLRSGGTVEGELRWTPMTANARTTDHLNLEAPYFEVHREERTAYVMKAHVASVTEVRDRKLPMPTGKLPR
ncbi:MAG: hypothetical protein KF773_29745 [Deltaproteobacteria bacterium]|nr:hypothetical protein [Deltaproteobacteria bacterium]MCW5803796.1 hypothetical protein [Deltaproteobacteria bacterium]